MVNLPRRFTGLPMVVWCRPANAQHDVRVKVSPVHGDRMIADQAITVAVRPQPNYSDGERRRSSSADFEAVARWVRRNQGLLLRYWHSQIDTNEFRRRIVERLANPDQERP
jgi:hypothetical protein